MTDDDKSKDSFEFKPLHKGEPEETPKPTEEEKPQEPVPTPEEILQEKPPEASSQNWFVRYKTLSLVMGFLLIGGAMWLISLSRDNSDPIEDPPEAVNALDEVPVNVIEVRLGRFQDPINAVGTLKGEAEIELRFEVEGRIKQFNVDEGDRVRQGQIIAKIDETDAMLKVKEAKNELEKIEKLYALGDLSKTKLRETRLKLEVAQSEFKKTRLIAVRNGIIGDKSAEIGEYVTPQRKIATLVTIKNVVVNVGIIEKQVDKVYPGQKILVSVDAYPGNVFEGTIASISPIITGPSKTFEIKAKIPNEESLLLPGMFARTRIITYEADDAMSVPNDTLVKAPGGFQVYVVNKDNVAEARDVEVGYVATEFTLIKSGLSPGEIVVVQKPPELKSGSKVKIIEVQNN
ncbi:hypothetical protein BVX98_05935 [bacterium F11]|nr:hypothetical protein BVX98_05935 [bacterium F11]